MTDRPCYLIIVSKADGIELFSAHYTVVDANTMRDRLEALIPGTSKVHLVQVPEIDGVVAAPAKPQKAEAPASAPSAQPVSEPAPAPYRKLSQEAFIEETRNLVEQDGSVRDTVVHYEGAFS